MIEKITQSKIYTNGWGFTKVTIFFFKLLITKSGHDRSPIYKRRHYTDNFTLC